MSALPPPMTYVPTPKEIPMYEHLFAMVADKGGSGVVIGSDAVPLFTTSKLPIPVLKQLWVMADARKTNSLNKAEFFVLVRLIQLYQNHERPIPNTGDLRFVVSGKTPDQLNPPFFEGITTNQQQQPPPMPPVSQQPSSASMQSTEPQNYNDTTAMNTHNQLTLHNSDPYTMTLQDKARFDSIFPDYASKDGYLYGREAVALFSKSGLNPSQLRQIWAMVDTQPVDNRLDALEFALAMHLIVCVSKKLLPLPETLPPNLLQWKQSSPSPRHSSTPNNPISTGFFSHEEQQSVPQSPQPQSNSMQQQEQVPPLAVAPPLMNVGPAVAAQQGLSSPPFKQQQLHPNTIPSPQAQSYPMQQHAQSAEGFSSSTPLQQQHYSITQSPQAQSYPMQAQQQQQLQPPTVARMSISDAFSDLDTVVSGGFGLNNPGGVVTTTVPAAVATKEELQEQANKAAAAYVESGVGGTSSNLATGKKSQDITPPSEIQFSSPSDALQDNKMTPPTLTASFSVYPTTVGAANVTTSLRQQNQTAGNNALSSADEDLVKLQTVLQQLRAENVSLKAQLSSFSEEERAVRLNIHNTLEEITSLQAELSSTREAVSKAKASLTDANYELKSLQEKKVIMTDWLDAERDMLKNLTDVQGALKEKQNVVVDTQEDLLLNDAVSTVGGTSMGMGFYGGEATSIGMGGFGGEAASIGMNGVGGESASIGMSGFRVDVVSTEKSGFGGDAASKDARPENVTIMHDESNLYKAEVNDHPHQLTSASYPSYDLSSMPSGPQDIPGANTNQALNSNSSWHFDLMGGSASAEHTVPPILNLGQVKSTDSFSAATDTTSLADLTAKIVKLKAEVEASVEISEAADEEQFHLGKRAEELKKAALKAQQEAQELSDSLNKKKGVFGGKDKKKQVCA